LHTSAKFKLLLCFNVVVNKRSKISEGEHKTQKLKMFYRIHPDFGPALWISVYEVLHFSILNPNKEFRLPFPNAHPSLSL
jgi:hypothetical protein